MKDPQTGKERKPILTMSFLRESDLTEFRQRAAEIIEDVKREKASVPE